MPHYLHESCAVKPWHFFAAKRKGLAPFQNESSVIVLDLDISFVNVERFPNRQDCMRISTLLTGSEARDKELSSGADITKSTQKGTGGG